MHVSVLGPIEVTRGAERVDLGTPKQRALVAALALSRGWPVSVDAIVDLLWEDAAPPGVTATLQAYVSQLRRVMEPERQRRAPATVLVTVAPGYALRLPDEHVDVHRFEQAVASAHRRLQPVSGWGPSALDADELGRCADDLDGALALWRGTPYAELGDASSAVAERARLEELRLVALEDRAVAGLALGQHATVGAELEALTSAHPLRERLWALRALALARSGRQADALDVLRQVREVLDEELGLEPSAELRSLQTAVLRQDPDLEWTAPTAGAGLPPAPEPTPEPAPHPHPATEQVAPWPMVGRDAELAALMGEVTRADGGVPAYAVLTGDPGIGKSRLAAELVLQARRRGALVLVGRCSEDDSAPPLWPWKTVLDGIGVSLLDASDPAGDEGGQFRAWERIVAALRAASVERLIVVVLDDLHWADTSTLRVLRLLVDSLDGGRLLVVATWRAHPEPTGALADVAEALARMHALRVELTGLPAPEVATVFESVAHRGLTDGEATQLRERTDGNPFFLVEFARLAGERGGRAGSAPVDLPTAVSEVINRRLLRLPEPTVTALRMAAVIGREFDTPTLAAVTAVDEDDLLDVVEPAQAAGLVREDGIDQFLFAHALVRDTLLAGMSASRRARAHARIAEVVSTLPGRDAETAWHWRGAGPAYADRAWRSAVVAADQARRLHAYAEAVDLLQGALTSLDHDLAATPADRYHVLLELIEAYRWAAQLPELVAAVEQAIEAGKAMRDPVAVARAACATTRGVVWRSAPTNQVNDLVVEALRGSLERLPAEDSEVRCYSMLALANELGHRVSYAERRALIDEGLAMAGRIGDPALELDAHQIAFVSLWCADTTPERLEHATTAMRLATETGNERAFVVSATLRAVVLGEMGRPAEMRRAVELARSEAVRLRIAFGEMVLAGLEVAWQAMAGDFAACEATLERVSALATRISHDIVDEVIAGSLIAMRIWQGRPLEVMSILRGFAEAGFESFSSTMTVYLWRGGEYDAARAHHAEHGAPLEHDSDLSMVAWGHAAEVALYLADPALGAESYELLAPHAGRSCGAGSVLAYGPVDAFLALAAAAAGETELAGRHAADAMALIEDWGIPLVGDWLADLRRTHGF